MVIKKPGAEPGSFLVDWFDWSIQLRSSWQLQPFGFHLAALLCAKALSCCPLVQYTSQESAGPLSIHPAHPSLDDQRFPICAIDHPFQEKFRRKHQNRLCVKRCLDRFDQLLLQLSTRECD